MAHVAVVHAVLKTSAPVATQDAPQTDDGGFAAVLASLTPKTEAPKTEAPEAKPHGMQAQPAPLTQAEAASEPRS